MKLPQRGIDFIKEQEGLSLRKIIDGNNRELIGYGHELQLNECYDKITKEKAEELLQKDIARIEYNIERGVSVPLTEGQFIALCSLIMQFGGRNFLDSHARKLLNGYFYKEAAEKFFDNPKLNTIPDKENPKQRKPCPILMARRAKEKEFFYEKNNKT